MSWLSRGAPLIVAGAIAVCQGALAGQEPAPAPQSSPSPASQTPDVPHQEPIAPRALQSTPRAVVPRDLDDVWLVPPAKERAAGKDNALQLAATAYASGDYTSALASLRRVSNPGTLAPYVLFYQGLANLRLSHGIEALKAFDELIESKPDGYLSVGALLGKAEADELIGDHKTAADLYEKASTLKAPSPDDVLARFGRASLASGDRKRAAGAFLRVYYEFPLSDAATGAEAALESLRDQVVRTSYKADFGRAQMLFGARRYADARSAFQDIRSEVSGDDRELADLRLAESDFFLKRYAAARDALTPYLDRASRRAEARFFYLSAIRELGNHDQYVSLTRALVNDFPDSTWSEEALNNLGTYYILDNEDELAAQSFKESFERFPGGQHAERSAWKYGWWAYKTANYGETVRVFEAAAATFPRSDYRPSYLYWAARAHGRLGERTTAESRMRLVYADYMNSYYGRLARKRLNAQQASAMDGAVEGGAVRASLTRQVPASPDPPPTAPLIRKLLAAGLYDDALSELRYAQRSWGTSPVIEATIAWVYHEKGDLRRAITAMRRAYPQHMAEGGEGLPAEVLQVIFPLTYWDSIRRNSAAHDLDPYVMAALIAQESTFDPGAHSSANAWGLMQIVPSTGRRLAPAIGIRRFRTPMLTNADTNIRLGTLYFSRLVEQFGGTYYALASYNAGESRVVRWKSERPGLDEDEFIDDIPFPETQNYVKRILGTAEDYRRLYGEGGGQARPVMKTSNHASSSSASKKSVPAKKKPATTKKKKKG
ncbi:MAG TPA: transglycosylase SLT domain-containing protein [Vicinamibacterales bacterium]|jgi:soluble lytic murein transglycosylase